MPTKGNVRRITIKALSHKKNKAVLRKIRKKRKISQAVQRETPLRSRFPFSLSVCVTACACLAERSDATCHRQAHAVVPKSLFVNRMLNVLDKYFLWLIINFS